MRGLSVLLLWALPTGCSLESNQSASECEAKLLPNTLSHVTRMPAALVLKRDARSSDIEETGVIAHQLWGDKAKFPALARVFEARGFKTSVEPEEYGDHLRIDEPVESFRRHAAERIKQLCMAGDQMNLRYNGWWLYAGPHTDYVMQ